MAVIALWRGQGVADNTTLTTSTVGTGDTAFTAVASAPTVQVLAGRDRPEIEITNNATATQFRWGSLSLATWAVRLYFRSLANPASALASIVYVTHAGGRLFTINYNTNGTFTLLNAAGTFVAASDAINVAKMYRIDVTGGTSGNIDLRVYECDAYNEVGTPFWSRTTQAIGSTAPLTQAIFGRQSGGAYGPGYFSEFALADSVGEIGTADTAPVVDPSTLELWWGNGSSFTRVECLWGNGSGYTALETHWPGEAALRNAVLHPFTSASLWNTALGDGATFGPLGTTTSAGTDSLSRQFRSWIDPSDGVLKIAPGQANSAQWSTYVNIAAANDPDLTIRPVEGGTWGPKSASGNEVTIKAPATVVLAGDITTPQTRVNYAGDAGATGGAITFTNIGAEPDYNWQPDGFGSFVEPDPNNAGQWRVTEAYKSCWAPNNPADPVATPRTPNPSGRVIIARRGVINTYSLSGDGWSTPSGRASRLGFLTGLIRAWELNLSQTNPEYAIQHALAVAMHASQMLKPSLDTNADHPAKTANGYQWPARAADGHAESVYAGTIRMGMQFALLQSFDIEAAGLTDQGKALAYALKFYGCYACDISAYTPTLYIEQGVNSVLASNMKEDWQNILMHKMVPVLNNTSTNIGGPGNRLRPPLPALA